MLSKEFVRLRTRTKELLENVIQLILRKGSISLRDKNKFFKSFNIKLSYLNKTVDSQNHSKYDNMQTSKKYFDFKLCMSNTCHGY